MPSDSMSNIQPLKALHLHYHIAYGHQTDSVTYDEELPPIKSHDPLITWSCRIT